MRTDKVVELEGGGLPLGIMAEASYEEYTCAVIRPDQICFVGTDGVWEAANLNGEMFGKDRLVKLIRQYSSESSEYIAAKLREALATFRGAAKQGDDVTFVVLKVRGITA